MSASPDVRAVAVRDSVVSHSLRHPAIVRVAHWITTISFFALFVSGIAILLAHPRLYWGETGAVGAPSLIDLPLPFVLNIPIRGPGRYLHFLSAWAFVITGLIYVIAGTVTQHFRRHLLPDKSQFGWEAVRQVVSNHLRLKPLTREDAVSYNLLQRLTYLVVVFVLAPMVIWTGLAMSPAITSVFPAIVTIIGGQQSARTIHFLAAFFLVLFLVIHILMVSLAGFVVRTRAMITGRIPAGKEPV